MMGFSNIKIMCGVLVILGASWVVRVDGAEGVTAIVGGGQNQGGPGVVTPYSALVSSTGVATQISGDAPVAFGQIRSVAMNRAGASIIGGTSNGFLPYAALISPAGVGMRISGDVPTVGDIFAVALNDTGAGILGGRSGSASPYAAVISSAGVATAISGGVPTGNGTIQDVAINSAGVGVIGGVENGSVAPYLAFVSSSGVATKVPLVLPTFAPINSVSINSTGTAVIGGTHNTIPYAAFVSPSGTVTPLIVGTGDGTILSVDINDAGMAVLGGQDQGNTMAYAALVSPLGAVTEISGDFPTGTGRVESVAINTSGVAILGGRDNMLLYAALVSPTGVATRITGDASGINGAINGVAIDDSGVAIIGGVGVSAPYMALVSPGGVATAIVGDLPLGNGFIASVALASTAILSNAVPKTFGIGSTVPNSLFILSSQVLSNHLTSIRTLFPSTISQQNPALGLVVDASGQLQKHHAGSASSMAARPHLDTGRYQLWMAPFGNYTHQKQAGQFPSSKNWIAGVMAALDYHGENTVIGVGAAYAFNHAHLGRSMGHAKVHQELVTFYGSWARRHLYTNFALWGGVYQTDNLRHSIANITSTSHVDGWVLDPHLEISTPFYAKGDWLLMDPFAMCDWVSNWQGHIHERGASGLNLRIGHQYTSCLRTEVGLRIYETIPSDHGTWVLQEKASWVHKLPFRTGAAQAIFVAGISSFAVELFSPQTQNLGAVQLNAAFFPCRTKAFGSLNYQGEFGAALQSHVLAFEIGTKF